jgi:hypothetical protein
MLAGCRPDAATSSEAASAPPASSAETGYVNPPEVAGVQRAGGALVISGRSDPGARVRLSSPDAGAYGATANETGAWSLTTPAPQAVRLFGLSEVLGGRAVQGGSYLAVLPEPGRPAVLLRAGGGSAVLGGAATSTPQITAIDYDAGGGAVISGLAKPGVSVRLTVDGGAAGEAKPDDRGQFSIPLGGALKAGAHEAVIQSQSGQGAAAFSVSAPAAIKGLPYAGQREAGDWRIDWLTPGGGPQATLVLDPATGS